MRSSRFGDLWRWPNDPPRLDSDIWPDSDDRAFDWPSWDGWDPFGRSSDDDGDGNHSDGTFDSADVTDTEDQLSADMDVYDSSDADDEDDHDMSEPRWPLFVAKPSGTRWGSRFPPRPDAYFVENVAMSIRRLAEWAFGPYGLPHLRVLAVGDFSHGDRYAPWNVLLCRKPSAEWEGPEDVDLPSESKTRPFRHVVNDDVHLVDYIEGKMDFLGSCAVDPAWSL